VTLALAGETRTYTVAETDAAGGLAPPAPVQLSPARRRPTPEEIRRINAALADMERGETTPKVPAMVPSTGVQP
jgi:hypothetical protein